MQNKRGISQAFSQPPEGITLRRATVFDVFDLSRVLIRSITELCGADHQGDPRSIALWTANKDAATIRGWIEAGSQIWLAEHAGQVAAVGGLSCAGLITLLYVDPAHTRRGVGAALLSKLEQQLAAAGCATATLDATCTARAFYIRQGWQPTDAPGEWNGIPQFPMRKSLHPTD
ncbi:GNAT family N-acetyltransferase [Rhodobacteraceae bacterium B1Z28]|uniref:GNAT family N-acetyltransferase n=1 Tax=Ruegeria haliotis TaxID=2747601 RepID=A0ABX2PLC8_9RHOB|nr:GNAT family N-acetyltransferase [Ruegeria haliotis]NVO54276.1 GNAT family N-acetyltransferase [Ruegeria haliotis]